MRKQISKLLLILTTGLIAFGCCDDDKVDKATQQKIEDKIAVYEQERLEREDLESSIQNSILIEAEVQDAIKISDELKLNTLETSETIKDLIDNKFIKSQSRYNLFKIVGHTAKLVDENESSKKYEVELFSYLNDSIKPEIINPGKDGLLSELNITKNMSATLKFFIADGQLEDNQIYHGTVSETSNVIIDEKELDLNKIKKEFKTPESMKNVELITRVTVTEYVHKKYRKRSKKIKVKEFPLIGSGVSLGTDFYTESSRMERSFKVSIDTTPIEDVVRRLSAK